MKTRIAFLILIALPVFGADEMRKLDFLVGDWKGEAQVSSGPGKGERALQVETVRTKQGGKLLVVESEIPFAMDSAASRAEESGCG